MDKELVVIAGTFLLGAWMLRPVILAVAELDALRHRLAEFEERVDFTERLMAQRRAEAPLPPPRV